MFRAPLFYRERRWQTPRSLAGAMISTLIIIVLIAWSEGVAAVSAGRVFYVAITGKDSNAGTSRSSAWGTIQHAADTMLPGDRTCVLGGSYPERVKVSNSGAPGAIITFQSDKAATPVTMGFEVSADYVRIEGFEITNQASTDPEGYGVHLIGSFDVIAQNYIHDLYFEGIMVSGAGDPNSPRVAHNTISNNRIVRAAMAGIHVEGRGTLIVGNDVSWTRQYPLGGPKREGADADGMRFFGSAHDFRSNYIHDIPYGTTENVDPHIDCFQTWGPAKNIVIERNFCIWPSTSESTDNEVSSIESSGGTSTNVIYRNNIFTNMRQGLNIANSPYIKLFNNTFDNVLEEAIILSSSPQAAIENNVFYDVGSGTDSYACIDAGSQAGMVIKTNDHYMSRGTPGQYCSNASHLALYPWFVNPNAANFHLQAKSKLIDIGTTLRNVPNDFDGTRRPQGNAFDIGAFEYH